MSMKEKNIVNNKKRILIAIFAILVITIAGTVAWLTWRSNNTALVLTIGDNNDAQVILKPYKIDTTILPVNTYSNEDYTSVSAINNSSSNKNIKLFYRMNQIDEELISSDFKYTITKSIDNGNTYTEYITGDFSNATSNTDLYIMDENIPSNENIKYKVYVWLDGSNGEQTGIQGKSFVGELRAEIITKMSTGADMLISKTNPSTLSYNSATTAEKGEMWTFSHGETEQVPATTDYRYIGNTPNNYITFNNEVWRIIGVFAGKIKIIKDTSIGGISRDYKQSNVGSSTFPFGSNDWSDSQLMYMLNPTTYTLKSGYTLDGDYIKDNNNNIIYQINHKPASIATGATSYSGAENTWYLNNIALSQVETTTYYLGGRSSYSEIGADGYYNFERGTTVPSGRPNNWTGQVALMYPSDYAYTYAFGVDNKCYTDTFNCTTSENALPSSSWLYKVDTYQWTISPCFGDTFDAFLVANTGGVYGSMSNLAANVFPVVYLKSDIKLQGTGTGSNPYVIVG